MMHFKRVCCTMQLRHLVMTPEGTRGDCACTVIFHFSPHPFITEPQRSYNWRGSLLSLRCRLHFLLRGEWGGGAEIP